MLTGVPNFLKVYLRYHGPNEYVLRLHNLNENVDVLFESKFGYLLETTLTINQPKIEWT